MSNGKKGRSKRAHVLVQELIEATGHFLKQGNEIAQENPDMKNELTMALNDVKRCGDTMAVASKDFADDPFLSQKRAIMVAAARELLNAVARLLAIADMIDIRLLFKVINLVSSAPARFTRRTQSMSIFSVPNKTGSTGPGEHKKVIESRRACKPFQSLRSKCCRPNQPCGQASDGI
jgi:hypothetical protein